MIRFVENGLEEPTKQVQFLPCVYQLKIRIYLVYIMFRNTKFAQYLERRQGHIHTKILLTISKNKFKMEKINYKQTHIPVAISLLWYKTQEFVTH